MAMIQPAPESSKYEGPKRVLGGGGQQAIP